MSPPRALQPQAQVPARAGVPAGLGDGIEPADDLHGRVRDDAQMGHGVVVAVDVLADLAVVGSEGVRNHAGQAGDAQDVVAVGVAQRIIDAAETVEVEQRQRDPGFVAPAHSQGLCHPVAQQRLVRQIGQRIVKRQRIDPLQRRRLPARRPRLLEGPRELLAQGRHDVSLKRGAGVVLGNGGRRSSPHPHPCHPQ